MTSARYATCQVSFRSNERSRHIKAANLGLWRDFLPSFEPSRACAQPTAPAVPKYYIHLDAVRRTEMPHGASSDYLTLGRSGPQNPTNFRREKVSQLQRFVEQLGTRTTYQHAR